MFTMGIFGGSLDVSFYGLLYNGRKGFAGLRSDKLMAGFGFLEKTWKGCCCFSSNFLKTWKSLFFSGGKVTKALCI